MKRYQIKALATELGFLMVMVTICVIIWKVETVYNVFTEAPTEVSITK